MFVCPGERSEPERSDGERSRRRFLPRRIETAPNQTCTLPLPERVALRRDHKTSGADPFRFSPISARALRRAMGRRNAACRPTLMERSHASLFRPAAAYDRSASGRNTCRMTSYRFSWSAAGRSAWRLPAISAGAVLPARWSSRATARSISRAWIWSASAPWNSAGAGALFRRWQARAIRATMRKTNLSDQPHRLRVGARALSRHRPGAAAEAKPAAARALPAKHVRSDFARFAASQKMSRCATARGSSRSRKMTTGSPPWSRMPRPARAKTFWRALSSAATARGAWCARRLASPCRAIRC